MIVKPPNPARFNPQQAGCSCLTFVQAALAQGVDLGLTLHCASDQREDGLANTRVSAAVLSLLSRRRDQFGFEEPSIKVMLVADADGF
jgi:hypothetical protein